jgi:hypothetical protein
MVLQIRKEALPQGGVFFGRATISKSRAWNDR